jgi:DNA-binding CsgD family transcriptional regulator
MADLAALLLDEIDVAVLVFSSDLGALLYRNPAACALLQRLGDAEDGAALEPLRRAARTSLTADVAGRGTTQVVVQVAGDRALVVRAKRLRTAPGAVLLSVSAGQPEDVQLPRRLAHEYGLTPRRCKVVRLVGQGRSNETIARELGVSLHTVKHDLAEIFVSVGVRNRTELMARVCTPPLVS